MRIVFSIIMLLTFHPVLAQNRVDQEFGLGPFKFNTDISVWEDQLTGTLQISYGQDYYLYTGNDQKILYHMKVNKVNLGFFKDKLNYVDYYFKKLDNLAFDALLEQLSADFGTPEKITDPHDMGIMESYRWLGQKSLLQLIRYGPETIDWDDRDMTVIIMELSNPDQK